MIAFGKVGFVTEIGGGELVGLVKNDQVPVTLLQLMLIFLIPAQLIEAGDEGGEFKEGIPGGGRFELIPGKQIEIEVEFVVQLILPLFGKTSRADNQASVQSAANLQFTNQEACHDGFAGTGIIREQKPQRLAGKHLFVYCGNLVRQGFDK